MVVVVADAAVVAVAAVAVVVAAGVVDVALSEPLVGVVPTRSRGLNYQSKFVRCIPFPNIVFF